MFRLLLRANYPLRRWVRQRLPMAATQHPFRRIRLPLILIWALGSAIAGRGCFTCITGESSPTGDYEMIAVR
jgi:hypothetical protein